MTEIKLRVREIVVVEGLHDAQRVHEAVDADVWVVGGDRVAQRFLRQLKRAQVSRGIVILTDPDGPGERIRRRLAQAVPEAKHAFIKKADALAGGRVGVEFARPEKVREALVNARASVPSCGQARSDRPLAAVPYTLTELMEMGLAGDAGASRKRALLGDILRIGRGNAKGFLKKLNELSVSREEWEEALHSVEMFALEQSEHGDTVNDAEDYRK